MIMEHDPACGFRLAAFEDGLTDNRYELPLAAWKGEGGGEKE